LPPRKSLEIGCIALESKVRTMPKRQPAGKPTKNVSAGLLLYRWTASGPEVFLAHPGGPFWAKKDAGAWTIPKGLVEDNEDPLAAAQREFHEETSIRPTGPYLELGKVQQKSGKIIHAWAFVGNADPTTIQSNLVPVKTGSGWRQFPEIDRCGWFTPEEAGVKLNPAQTAFVVRLLATLAAD
jgi:predicted NUDIX family NTP pyrophosphohydrolase